MKKYISILLFCGHPFLANIYYEIDRLAYYKSALMPDDEFEYAYRRYDLTIDIPPVEDYGEIELLDD